MHRLLNSAEYQHYLQHFWEPFRVVGEGDPGPGQGQLDVTLRAIVRPYEMDEDGVIYIWPGERVCRYLFPIPVPPGALPLPQMICGKTMAHLGSLRGHIRYFHKVPIDGLRSILGGGALSQPQAQQAINFYREFNSHIAVALIRQAEMGRQVVHGGPATSHGQAAIAGPHADDAADAGADADNAGNEQARNPSQDDPTADQPQRPGYLETVLSDANDGGDEQAQGSSQNNTTADQSKRPSYFDVVLS
ncbi:MAG: hypothetical protein GOMPHAMPRED_002407 [Gomphillus americanus]|uniref:Uncharacterized protein n=1 Tax=Gomphillus americanus TaxID=1940652 RepID=A0A8H3FDV2_9LECA|nr:MAG: hypothetical protein GOMPHAMPRED_002407 [Gomphillus americanus]